MYMSDNNNDAGEFPTTDEISKMTQSQREERCNKWKQKGNDTFANKDYRLAEHTYTEALKYDNRDYKVYSNRSYCYFLLGEAKKSASDAMVVIHLQPKWTKGYFRLGYAYCAMKQYLKALEAFAAGLELDAGNAEIQAAFRQTKESLSKQVYETVTWSPRAILGSAGAKQRCGHTATMIGYNMFLIGGISQGFVSSITVVNTDSMTQITKQPSGDVPEDRAAHTSVLWGNNIVIFGGTSGDKYFNSVYALNTESKKWRRPRTKGSSPPSRNSHCVCLVGNRIIIHGGCNGAENYFDDLWVLDLETFTWSQPVITSSQPSPRISHTANLLGNRMYIFGGMTKVKGEPAYISDAWILDTESYSWHRPESLGEPPKPRMGHSSCQLGKRIYIFGGDSGNNVLDDIVVGETDLELQRLLSDLKEETVKMQEEMTKLQKRKAN